MAEPDRTYAIVVGIETYQGDSNWNLSGPASDALDCVEWLRDCLVPPQQISLLLAPRPKNQATVDQRVADVGIEKTAIKAPHLDHIEDAFADAEQVVDADLLIIYWSGHGIIDRGDQRMLLAANATEHNPRSFPIQLRLQRLMDSKVQAFPQQIAIIDACADFIEKMNWPTEPAGARAKLDRRLNVEQATLYAAMAGQSAAIDTARGYGEFSRHVLTEIVKGGKSLPPDMDTIAKTAIEHFDAKRANNPSGQLPVYALAKGFGQRLEERFGERPRPAAVHEAARLAGLTGGQLARLESFLSPSRRLAKREQRDAMLAAVLPAGAAPERSPEDSVDTLECLRAVTKHNKLNALCDWLEADESLQSEALASLELRRLLDFMKRANDIYARLGNFGLTKPAITAAFFAAIGDPHGASPPEDIVPALEKLLSEPDYDGVARVGRFLIHLEHECVGDAVVAPDLLEDLGIGVAKANELRQVLTVASTPRPRLVIDLHGRDRMLDDTGWPQALCAWLQFTDGTWCPYDDAAADGTAEGTERAFETLVDWGWKKANREPVIEMIVPRCLMATAFETWKVAEPLAKPRTVGTRHPLVLRWGERFWDKDLQTRWKDRCAKIDAALQGADPNIHWVGSDAAADPNMLQNDIEHDLTWHCVGLEFAPEAAPADLTQDPLVATLRAGVGYALWFHDLPADLTPLKQAVKLLLISHRIDEFPERLMRLRAQPKAAETKLAKRLTVLWDDPAGLPPLNQSSEPT